MTHTPEYHHHEEFQNRLKKLNEIKALHINPYPNKYTDTQPLKEIINNNAKSNLGHSEDAENGKTPPVKAAGRLVLFRAMGKNSFAQIQEGESRLQLMFNRDHTVVEGFTPTEELSHIKFIEKKLDLGDIIGVEGNLFFTNKGELTIYVKKLTLLCKSLLPLADKHGGLADKGMRYRKRWLDLISNKEAMHTLKLRSDIIREVRNYMEKANFAEVETAILHNTYGGAEAKPFTTMLNALHQEMFMRISLEISLKKLIIGGLDRVYEIGKVFRNEGLDKTHNPEFTLLEGYAAYWDYNDLMIFVENLFAYLAIKLYGDTKIQIEDKVIDLKAPWKRISYKDAIKTYADIDVDKLSDEAIKEILLKNDTVKKEELTNASKGQLMAFLFENFVEDKLIQPHHIIDHPIETTPLCKLHRDEEKRKEGLVERFESFILGHEFVNAYTELNDPVLQRQLLETQAQRRLKGVQEVPPLDEEFIEAICQGLPPTGGFGIGIDRLCMLLTKANSIKDVIYFPMMKPEEESILPNAP
jgi:lysyl-tRNA synthetase class 2